jgi:glutamine amidotransferase
VESLRALHPGLPFLKEASDDSRLIVSEPLGDLPGVWNKVPESSYGVVQPEGDDLRPFVPCHP